MNLSNYYFAKYYVLSNHNNFGQGGGGQKPSLKKVVKHLSFVTVIACPLPVYSSFDQEPVWEFDWFAQDAQ